MKSTAELRAFLLKRMVNLAEGKESLPQAQAAAALAKQVNATLALELQASRLTASSGENSVKPLMLE